VQYVTRSGLAGIAPHAIALAEAEGLRAHADSIRVRRTNASRPASTAKRVTRTHAELRRRDDASERSEASHLNGSRRRPATVLRAW
jgi:hypothetical protein